MSEDLYNLFFFIFMGGWLGGFIVLVFRISRASHNYLRNFRSAEGFPLDWYSTSRYTPEGRQAQQLFREAQHHPELERLRREVWRRTVYLILWAFGFPLVAFGVGAVLIQLLWHPPH